MMRSEARKAVWVGRTASTVFRSELARNCGGDVLLLAGRGAARDSGTPLDRAGVSGQPDGRDAA
jgi:hypothetical protein